MSLLPDIATFASVVTDSRFAAGVAIALLSGAVRGFAGFGSALIYVPLMSAVYGPRVAAASFLLIDFATGLAFVFSVWRHTAWREVLPLSAAAIFAAQFGALILLYTDPATLRWSICVVVAVVVGVLISGWRYHGRPRLVVTLAVGFIAGLIGGAVQISGPPVILYWLGSMHEMSVLRANFITYFGIFAGASVVTYLVYGLLNASVIALAVILGPLHIFAMWAGARVFHFASEQTYRRTAFVIIALSAIVSMPITDRLLR